MWRYRDQSVDAPVTAYLPPALLHLVVSVCPSACFHSVLESTYLWPLYFARTLVITIARRMSGMDLGFRLAKTVTRSV